MKGFFADEIEPSTYGGVERVDVLAKLTQTTLHVIAAAGFGMSLPWSAFSEKSPAEVAKEKETERQRELLPFHDSIQTSIRKLAVPILIPRFFKSFRVPWLSDQLDSFDRAYASLNVHMRDLANAARQDLEHEQHDGVEDLKADLLRRLVKANESMKGSTDSLSMRGTLTDEEMFSNIFVSLPIHFCRPGLTYSIRCFC